jgi:hypothetical protein
MVHGSSEWEGIEGEGGESLQKQPMGQAHWGRRRLASLVLQGELAMWTGPGSLWPSDEQFTACSGCSGGQSPDQRREASGHQYDLLAISSQETVLKDCS